MATGKRDMRKPTDAVAVNGKKKPSPKDKKEESGGAFVCSCCGHIYKRQEGNFYTSKSLIYKGNGGFMSICKECIASLLDKFILFFAHNEESAFERICQITDTAFDKTAFRSSLPNSNQSNRFGVYLAKLNLIQKNAGLSNGDRTYSDTLIAKWEEAQKEQEDWEASEAERERLSIEQMEQAIREKEGQYEAEKEIAIAESVAACKAEMTESFQEELNNKDMFWVDELGAKTREWEEKFSAQETEWTEKLDLQAVGFDETLKSKELEWEAKLAEAISELEELKNVEVEVGAEDPDTYKPTRTVVKRFGGGFAPEDYDALQTEYESWVDKMGKPEDKRQEELYVTICFLKLNLQKSIKSNTTNGIGALANSYKAFIEAATTEIEDRKRKVEAETKLEPIGMLYRDIEQYTPAEFYKDKKLYADFDKLKDYVSRFMTRPLKNLLTGSKDLDNEFNLSDTEE